MIDNKEAKQTKQIDYMIPQALLDHVIATYNKPADLFGQNGLLKQLTKAAIEAVFPRTEVQLCLVHLVRHSLNFVRWKPRKDVAADLRTIYTAVALEKFAARWDAQYPQITKSWRNNWARNILFFAYAPQIRKVIYTTNTIESVNFSLRKLIKTRGAFPTDEAATKLLYLGLCNIGKRRTMAIHNWKQAMCQLMIRFDKEFNPA